MSFKSRLSSVSNRIKSAPSDLTDSISHGLADAGSDVKRRFASDAKLSDRLKNAKGFDKAKVLANSAGGFTQKTLKFLKNLSTFVRNNKVLIWIVMAIFAVILGLTEFSLYVSGVSASFKPTPHYYCDVNAPEEVKKSALYLQYCKVASSDNSSIADAAITLATTDRYTQEKIAWTQSGLNDVINYLGKSGYTVETFISVGPKLLETLNSLTNAEHSTSRWPQGIGTYYASCDLNSAMPVWWSGADDNFPSYLFGNEENNGSSNGITGYLLNAEGNGRWRRLQEGERIEPGDIAIGPRKGDIGHVWMYVATWENGKWIDNSLVQEKFPGSKSNRYEGSHQDYYPCLSVDDNPWASSAYIFRCVAKKNSNSQFLTIQP